VQVIKTRLGDRYFGFFCNYPVTLNPQLCREGWSCRSFLKRANHNIECLGKLDRPNIGVYLEGLWEVLSTDPDVESTYMHRAVLCRSGVPVFYYSTHVKCIVFVGKQRLCVPQRQVSNRSQGLMAEEFREPITDAVEVP